MYTSAQFAREDWRPCVDDPEMGLSGDFTCQPTSTNRRSYTDSGLAAALGLPGLQKDHPTVAYCRVSGRAKSRIERIKKEYLISSVTSNILKSMNGSRKLAAG
jgi:hypothetical protein